MTWNMKPLQALVKRVTGKEVRWRQGHWYQDHEAIYVPAGDLEGLLHELGHWVIANPTERTWPNLLLDEWEAIRFDVATLPGWLRSNYGGFERSYRLERAAVYFEWRCLKGVFVETKEECVEWLFAHAGAGDSAGLMEAMVKRPELRRAACKRVSRYLPYRGLVEDVRAALMECRILEG